MQNRFRIEIPVDDRRSPSPPAVSPSALHDSGGAEPATVSTPRHRNRDGRGGGVVRATAGVVDRLLQEQPLQPFSMQAQLQRYLALTNEQPRGGAAAVVVAARSAVADDPSVSRSDGGGGAPGTGGASTSPRRDGRVDAILRAALEGSGATIVATLLASERDADDGSKPSLAMERLRDFAAAATSNGRIQPAERFAAVDTNDSAVRTQLERCAARAGITVGRDSALLLADVHTAWPPAGSPPAIAGKRSPRTDRGRLLVARTGAFVCLCLCSCFVSIPPVLCSRSGCESCRSLLCGVSRQRLLYHRQPTATLSTEAWQRRWTLEASTQSCHRRRGCASEA